MSRDAAYDADVLNRLIARLRAAARGYRAAGSDGPGLADAFAAAADSHDHTAEVLASDVHALGTAPAEAPALEQTHGAWSDLPGALAQGRRATTQAVESVEAELVGEFRSVMGDPAVSGPVRDAVMRAFDGVEAGRDAALRRLDAPDG